MATRERYTALDGIRAIAAICIILMHVKANGNYDVPGFVYDRVITSFTNFTYLFMLLSAFSLCCGYYERFSTGTISLEEFYKRRYQRVWPYFAVLCTLELIVEHSLHSLYEWFADLTLAFGLLPNANITVVGVGWFLGTIFAFYMVFPFFTVLIANRKRAWFSLGIFLILNYLCTVYFFDNDHVTGTFAARTNLVFSFVFFITGGLVYLYRVELKRIFSSKIWILILILLAVVVFYFTVNNSVYVNLALFALIAIIGVCVTDGAVKILLENKVVCFIGSISMEMYLSHMLVFRVIEKLRMLHITGSDLVNYVISTAATIIGAIIVSILLRKIIQIVMRKCGHG